MPEQLTYLVVSCPSPPLQHHAAPCSGFQLHTTSTNILHQLHTTSTNILRQLHTTSTAYYINYILHQLHTTSTNILHQLHTTSTTLQHGADPAAPCGGYQLQRDSEIQDAADPVLHGQDSRRGVDTWGQHVPAGRSGRPFFCINLAWPSSHAHSDAAPGIYVFQTWPCLSDLPLPYRPGLAL